MGCKIYFPEAVTLLFNGTPKLSTDVGTSKDINGGVEYFFVVLGATLIAAILVSFGFAATLAKAEE